MENLRKRTELIQARSLIEDVYEWHRWTNEIPFINFKESWNVKIIPPLGGVVARFIVSHKDNKDASVSVYLDCYDVLAHFGEPYWEIYPYEHDVYRVPMNDIDELIERIDISIFRQLQEKRGEIGE